MVVLCIAAHYIYLLCLPLSTLAKQAVKMEVLFTFTIVAVKVFYMVYVVMIVAQQTQVVHITSLLT
jgi:hypothetical protein